MGLATTGSPTSLPAASGPQGDSADSDVDDVACAALLDSVGTSVCSVFLLVVGSFALLLVAILYDFFAIFQGKIVDCVAGFWMLGQAGNAKVRKS